MSTVWKWGKRIYRHRRFRAMLLIVCFVMPHVCCVMPVPGEKDLSQPYPCQHHACGCRSAKECWTRCGCFSREQKLAWARANGVTPPPEGLCSVEEVAPAEKPTGKCRGGCCAHKQVVHSCCKEAQPTCCHKPEPPADPQSAGCCASTRQKESSNVPAQGQVIIVAQYMGCRGMMYRWLLTPVISPVTTMLEQEFRRIPEYAVPLTNDSVMETEISPPVPPPRWGVI